MAFSTTAQMMGSTSAPGGVGAAVSGCVMREVARSGRIRGGRGGQRRMRGERGGQGKEAKGEKRRRKEKGKRHTACVYVGESFHNNGAVRACDTNAVNDQYDQPSKMLWKADGRFRKEWNSQATEEEDTDELYLPTTPHMEPPDHRYRQQNDGKIRKNVDGTGDTCCQQDIDAAAWYVLVPCLVHGCALKD